MTHPIKETIESFAGDQPKCLRIGTKNTESQLIGPQMKNIMTNIAAAMTTLRLQTAGVGASLNPSSWKFQLSIIR